ncbi:winged helix DNA-binding domain-containing protein [Cellulomonas hominis]|uniref:Winged helix DNA-binding domain-containing protein n=1 Tax=Cellulomonas hominis TaxID=156981 RepID=A0A7Z8JYM7_9CELL|nr:crosslink repair DNA glycosylase YcaQ family protein [Cellulomonas hominis]TKR22811.1 winged helix DNA-binding domain-containing protein [Cellulomonas hominis]
MTVSSAQALAWRLGRQHLVSGAASAADAVRRLGAVPAWSGDADLAVRRRLTDPAPDAVAAAIRSGDLLRTFAFRGSSHLMAADEAGVYLAVRTASRQWALRSWQEHYGLRPEDWPALLDAVRTALAGGPLDREAFAAAVTAVPRFAHLGPALLDPSMTLLKPIAWHGALCFGPSAGGRPTFASPAASPAWRGLPDLDEAGRRAVVGYLGAYGPATRANLHYWLADGLSAGRRRVERWTDEVLADAAAEVAVGGEPALLLRAHVAEVEAAAPTDAVTLLAGHDQWVLGPGTADTRVVPAARRAGVTRGAALVLHGGVVAGTWAAGASTLDVTWFGEAGPPPQDALAAEAGRLAALLGHPGELRLTTA